MSASPCEEGSSPGMGLQEHHSNCGTSRTHGHSNLPRGILQPPGMSWRLVSLRLAASESSVYWKLYWAPCDASLVRWPNLYVSSNIRSELNVEVCRGGWRMPRCIGSLVVQGSPWCSHGHLPCSCNNLLHSHSLSSTSGTADLECSSATLFLQLGNVSSCLTSIHFPVVPTHWF